MSGNPFRASLVVQKHPAAASPTSFPPADSSSTGGRDEGHAERYDGSVLQAAAAPLKTKKTVRIESPTETIPPQAEFAYVDNQGLHAMPHGRRVSPPPDSPAVFADELQDRFPQDPTDRDVDVRGMQGSERKSMLLGSAAISPSGAPANPFSRTLASIEPQERGGDAAGQPKGRTAADRTAPGPKRQSLNVEGFKNLLMQGIAATPPNAPAPPSAVFESSSSTDTSSISRQSIFDPAQEPHPESPRTSYDMAASDDERAGLVRAEAPTKEKRKPPPAPRHRHGKLVKERTPQTVSFDDFSAAEPRTHKRTNSDLNKPLPPTPPAAASAPAHIISQDSTYDTSLPDTSHDEAAPTPEPAPTPPQKRAPPPVPLARRQSQLRNSSTGTRSRSNSSLTMSSQHSTDLPPIPSGQETPPTSAPTASAPSQKAPPPPPPSRRYGNAIPAVNTSATSPSTELPSSARPTASSPIPPSSRRTTLTSDPDSPVPAAPPTRTPSMHSARTPSRAVSGESTLSSASMSAPPPPPPRRRQSARSSLDLQRPTTDPKRLSRSSIDGKRQGSIASVSSALSREYTSEGVEGANEHALYSPREEVEAEMGVQDAQAQATERQGNREREAGSGASTILDDMDRFQREIDALRARYKEAA